ncbi:MAG: hypothetical protein ACKOWF_05625 [Chloroflexota bacterium]
MPTMEPPPPGRSRVEDEIREILERVDREPTVIDQVRGRAAHGEATVRRSVGHWRGGPPTPLAALGGAFGLAVAAYLLRSALPPVAALLAIASFCALASLWFGRAASAPQARMWRGRELDGPSPLDQWRARRGWHEE